MNKYATQGRLLIEALRKRPHTYLEMLRYGLSTSPWKRITECLHDTEAVKKEHRTVNGKRLVTWRIVRATRWTA